MLSAGSPATERAGVSAWKNQLHKTQKGNPMLSKTLKLTCAMLVFAAAATVPAQADEHSYAEGQVVNVAKIRTADGKFEDYMKWLATTWKMEQEASKKAGYIVGYEILTVEPRGPDDPDILLVIRYRNWAALDGALAKGDAIAKQFEGSVAAANQAQAERGKVRRVLGSETLQVLDLK
jgi:hypothetical protein